MMFFAVVAVRSVRAPAAQRVLDVGADRVLLTLGAVVAALAVRVGASRAPPGRSSRRRPLRSPPSRTSAPKSPSSPSLPAHAFEAVVALVAGELVVAAVAEDLSLPSAPER
jgi:hypothetical protein